MCCHTIFVRISNHEAIFTVEQKFSSGKVLTRIYIVHLDAIFVVFWGVLAKETYRTHCGKYWTGLGQFQKAAWIFQTIRTSNRIISMGLYLVQVEFELDE